MRRALWSIVAVLVLAAAALYHLSGPGSGPRSATDLERRKETAARLFVAEIAPVGGEPSVGPLATWQLILSHSDGTPVTDATVRLDGGMPDHGHGLPTRPEVTAEPAAGRYLVEGLKFSMPGLWVLTFAISTPRGSDEVSFNVAL